jgi:ATP adenylyltransferase
MKHLWAPWRFTYIKSTAKPRRCIFCIGPARMDRKRFVLYRGRTCYVLMNAYPYSNGHLMVAPYQHRRGLDGLDESTLGELLATAQRAMAVLQRVYKPQGFNVGINVGKAAGAGIEEHLHLHIVPRWNGDTNFMSSVGNVRVIPEGLDHGYRTLLPLFRQRTAPAPRRTVRRRRR